MAPRGLPKGYKAEAIPLRSVRPWLEADARLVLRREFVVRLCQAPRCVVYGPAGKPAAALAAGLWFSDNWGDAYGFDVAVGRWHRRKGLARFLVRQALDLYVEDGHYARGVRLAVMVVSDAMRRVLRRMGFVSLNGRDCTEMGPGAALALALDKADYKRRRALGRKPC